VKAIENLGIARVERLECKLSGRPLIVRGLRPTEGAYHRSEFWERSCQSLRLVGAPVAHHVR
jgi:hypothetical protein